MRLSWEAGEENLGINSTQFGLHSLWKVNIVQTNLVSVCSRDQKKKLYFYNLSLSHVKCGQVLKRFDVFN